MYVGCGDSRANDGLKFFWERISNRLFSAVLSSQVGLCWVFGFWVVVFGFSRDSGSAHPWNLKMKLTPRPCEMSPLVEPEYSNAQVLIKSKVVKAAWDSWALDLKDWGVSSKAKHRNLAFVSHWFRHVGPVFCMYVFWSCMFMVRVRAGAWVLGVV